MKKIVFIATLLVMLVVSINSYGQTTDSIKTNRGIIVLDGPSGSLRDPLFVLSFEKLKLEITNSELFKDPRSIKPDWIDSITVLKGKAAEEKYGARGKHGVVLVDLKENSFGLLSSELRSKFETKN
jgi:hypothetical protein